MTESTQSQIRLSSERTFSLIRIDSVDVVTPRSRAKVQFQENVRSISENSLYKPILVNAIEFSTSGRYQLICGEGRLRAHRELKKEHIKAEIITVALATAHLMSLGENMTKSPPRAIEYAYALLDMHERGATTAELERITGQSGTYINRYINLVRRGEDRLIKGVEKGIIPIDFAMRVAESPDGAIQHILIDAFDKKLITSSHVEIVRKLLIDRSRQGAGGQEPGARYGSKHAYSVDDLKRDIAKMTREKEKFVFAAESKETRLVRLIAMVRRLRGDGAFLQLLLKHQLDRMPELEESYV